MTGEQDGKYWNMKSMRLADGIADGTEEVITKSEKVLTTPTSVSMDRDRNITAQCLTKVVYGDKSGNTADVLATYKNIYKSLGEGNGNS